MMKRILALALALLLAAACCSCAKESMSGKLNRDDMLPESLVSLFAGAQMKPVRDVRDEGRGFASWAWEETSGTPKLLLVEIWMPPADCDSLYEQAKTGAEVLPLQDGASACYDGRAVHIRCGVFYVRMAMLGFQDENDAIKLLTARLESKLAAVK